MAERAGYDQPGDGYTERNGSFVLNVTHPYQPKQTEQFLGHVIHTDTAATVHTNTTVITHQPQPLNVPKRLPRHIIPALFVTAFCFCPTGIVAMYFAHKAMNLEISGDYGNAKKMSDCARKWIMATVCIGVIVITVSWIMHYALVMNYYENRNN